MASRPRLPDHEALSKWAHPLGKREPSEADIAKARLFFDEQAAANGYPRVGAWSPRERSNAIRRLAMLEMAKRQQAEWLRDDPDKVIGVERDEIGEAA